jgi:hypothetical protein
VPKRAAALVGARGLVGLGHAGGVLEHDAGVDAALERAAERGGERDRRLDRRRLDDLLRHGGGLRGRHVLIALSERVGNRVGDVDLLGAGLERAVEAAAVEHERRPDGGNSGEAREHVLGVRHVRDELRVDEAAGLDTRQPGGREPRAELRADARLEGHLVVPEAVARPDIAHAYRQGVDSSARAATNVSGDGMLH